MAAEEGPVFQNRESAPQMTRRTKKNQRKGRSVKEPTDGQSVSISDTVLETMSWLSREARRIREQNHDGSPRPDLHIDYCSRRRYLEEIPGFSRPSAWVYNWADLTGIIQYEAQNALQQTNPEMSPYERLEFFKAYTDAFNGDSDIDCDGHSHDGVGTARSDKWLRSSTPPD